jgi:hypothetical protein
MWTEDNELDENDNDSSSDNEDYNVGANDSDDDDSDKGSVAGPVLPASPIALPPLVQRNETTRAVLQRLS